MSEKYKPSQEEIEKAEEMAAEGEMTPEQEKMSKVRADDFEVGEKHGKHEVFTLGKKQFEKEKHDFEINEMVKELKLSDETKDIFLKGLAEYHNETLMPIKVTEEQLLMIIKELPVIKTYDVCHFSEIIMTQDIVDELLKHEELEKVCAVNYFTFSRIDSIDETKRNLLFKLEHATDKRRWEYEKNRK